LISEFVINGICFSLFLFFCFFMRIIEESILETDKVAKSLFFIVFLECFLSFLLRIFSYSRFLVLWCIKQGIGYGLRVRTDC